MTLSTGSGGAPAPTTPAPSPGQSRTLISYLGRTSSTTPAPAAPAPAEPAPTTPAPQRPSTRDADLLSLNAANYARAINPVATNPTNPPHATFNLYDPDDDERVCSAEDGGLTADVTDAIDHYQQLEAARLAHIAQQARVHLDSVASQGLQLAHVRVGRQQ